MATTVHHVGIGVIDEKPILKLFGEQLGFECISCRVTDYDHKWVVQRNALVFVITRLHQRSFNTADKTGSVMHSGLSTECMTMCGTSSDGPDLNLLGSGFNEHVNLDHTSNLASLSVPANPVVNSEEETATESTVNNRSLRCATAKDLPEFSTPPWQADLEHGSNSAPLQNSVYEVCIEVSDVEKVVERALRHGAEIVREVQTIEDGSGSVTYAVLKSCVGNVVHMIVNSQNYKGCFLPTFHPLNNEDLNDYKLANPIRTPNEFKYNLAFDHITLCVPPGKTLETLKWYENCLMLDRLLINKEENPSEGLVLSDIGMRMAAMQYWKCAEAGLSLGKEDNSIKFVIAESLEATPNQVTTFLRQHGCPGVQHIGLLTNQLVDVVDHLKNVGVPFLQPPHLYYQEVGKLNEIESCGESVNLLEKCGILLDSEAESVCPQTEMDDDMARYLMQVFTKPIFGDDTFFLEFLQRHGANGFGAGNISALWRAVKLYMERKGVN